jgi:transposase
MSLSSHALEKLIVEHYVYGNYSVPYIARKLNISEVRVRQILKESAINPYITSHDEYEVIMDKSRTLAASQPGLLPRIDAIYYCYQEVRYYMESQTGLDYFSSDVQNTIILQLARDFVIKLINDTTRELLGYQDYDVRNILNKYSK